MRHLVCAIAVCLLWSPTAHAQVDEPEQGKPFGSVEMEPATSQNILGSWIYTKAVAPRVVVTGKSTPRIVKDLLTVQADGSWRSRTLVDGMEDRGWPAETYGTDKPNGRWFLSVDTLWFSDPAKLSPVDRNRLGHHVTIEGKLLVVGGIPSRTCDYRIFKPTDSPTPAPPIVPSPTLRMGDVEGAWVSDRDTLTLRPDSTWTHWSEREKKLTRGAWAIVGGDLLWRYAKGDSGSYVKMILDDRLYLDEIGNSCTVYSREEASAVYSRIDP